MKQLTGLDAVFLYMETPSTFGHVNAVALYRRPDDPDFDPYEAFKAQMESRLHLLDPFRRRLVEVPLGLDHPYWINDPDFDLEFHVRHIAIPKPGEMSQLAAQVSRIIGRPMDRSKPLWEAYVMEGLADDHFAVFSKTHHATIDGAAGVQMLSMMLDADPAGDDIPTDDGSWQPEPVPSDLELLRQTAGSYLQRPYRLARFQLQMAQQLAEMTRSRGLQNVLSTVRRQLPPPWNGEANDRDLPALPAIRAPRTPFNGSISRHRRLAMASVPLSDIKLLKEEAGATVNDIVMAMCSGALRAYLEHHDVLPEQPLQAMVPVSVRTGEEDDIWTNRVSSLFVALPTNEADPLERIREMRVAMERGKEQFDLLPAETIMQVADFASPALAAQAARLASSLNLAEQATLPINVVISNVPGPRKSLYMGGAEMEHYFPVSTIAEGVGLNITVHSYKDHLDIGLVACREMVPDLDYLISLHTSELDNLFDALGVTRPKPAKKATRPAKSAKKPAKKAKKPAKKASKRAAAEKS
ncbi:MAG: WS/DGAT/MGAT family O-acyltransferase [Acidimicrobiales bacterium]